MRQEEISFGKVAEKFTQTEGTLPRERRKTYIVHPIRQFGLLSNNARLIEQVLYPVAFDSARRKNEGEKKAGLERAVGEGRFAREPKVDGAGTVRLFIRYSLLCNNSNRQLSR